MARDVERASRWIAVKPLMPAVGTVQPATRLVRTPLHLAVVRLLSSSAPPNAGHPPLSLVQGVPARPPQLRIVPKGRSQCSHHPARGPTPPTQRIANGGLTEPRRLPQTTDRGPARSFPQLTDARGEVGHQRRPQILHVHTLKQPGGGVAVTGPRRPSWRHGVDLDTAEGDSRTDSKWPQRPPPRGEPARTRLSLAVTSVSGVTWAWTEPSGRSRKHRVSNWMPISAAGRRRRWRTSSERMGCSAAAATVVHTGGVATLVSFVPAAAGRGPRSSCWIQHCCRSTASLRRPAARVLVTAAGRLRCSLAQISRSVLPEGRNQR